ncbi:DMT family transporter [Bauldia sp.]|uniref:DMT family transporter n=1 Tax=Bauldia sp. TaxID=2575872 RepID=UPI003BA90A79
MTPFRENLRGIIGVSVCNLLFLINDTMLKVANSEMPLGQLLFVRGLFAAVLLVPFVVATGAHRQFGLIWNWPLFWRTVSEILAAILFLTALFQMPIGNINAILQVVPLMVTACAAVFLGEYIGWRRWLAIGIGFTGVLIIIRPGLEGFNVFSLVALAAMGFITLRDMTTRVMSRAISALLIAFVTAIAVCLTGPVLGLVLRETWAPVSLQGFVLTAGAAVFLIGGYLTAVDFMRHGDISVIAPFRYSVVLWAILVGFLVWGEVPDLPMLIGTVVIVATGIYTFHRERRLAQIIVESDVDR